jgi:hypothetical protein
MLIIKTQSWIQQKNEGGGSLRNLKSLSSVKSVMNDLRRRSIFVSINPKCIHIKIKRDAGGGI